LSTWFASSRKVSGASVRLPQFADGGEDVDVLVFEFIDVHDAESLILID